LREAIEIGIWAFFSDGIPLMEGMMKVWNVKLMLQIHEAR
jgi:hypothetical protein